MSIATDFIAELNNELPATRRLLERVPDGKGPWKPHPKSSALGHLAQLVARLPGVMTNIVTGVDLDLAEGPGYSFEPTETLLSEFDRNVEQLFASLAAANDADFALTWRLLYSWRGGRHREPQGRAAKHRESLRPSPRAADGLPADERGSPASAGRPDGGRTIVPRLNSEAAGEWPRRAARSYPARARRRSRLPAAAAAARSHPG